MTYQVSLAPAATRQLKKLIPTVQQQIVDRLTLLELNPRPEGVIKLQGEGNFYRIRTGDYRIIYTIEDEALWVLVVKVGHRKEVYRE